MGEVDTKITTNNQTLKSTVMSEVDSKIPDVSVVKSEILGEVNPKLLDKETLKQEILSAVPTPANYTLTMEEDNLVLGKEGDDSYRKVINLSKYRDENTDNTNNIDIYSFIRKLELSTDENRSHYASEILYSSNLRAQLNDNKDIEIYNRPDYYYNGEHITTPYKILTISHTILSSQNVDVEQIKNDILASITIPNAETIKQDILAEVNPKLIDKDTFKQEILSALPAKDEYSIELTGDTLVLTKTNDPSYRKEINLSKYHDEVGQPINVESLKSDILSQVDTKISAIPAHTVTSDEVLHALNSENNIEKFDVLANTLMLSFSTTDHHLRFRKTDSSYEIMFDPDGDGDLPQIEGSPILTIPFSSLREIPTATQSEPITLEKIFELLNDDSKANVLNMIKNKLDIPEPVHRVKLISEPSVTNGVLKFNTETDAPTVDFTNDFYTKSKVDALLSNAAPSGPIEGHGRPDKKAELENAKIGTTYVDLDKTDGASIWMKKSKWVVIEGDTGDITLNSGMFQEDVKIRRINNTVIITPSVTTESNIKRDIFIITLDATSDNTNTTAMMHIDKLGFAPLVTSTHESTWYFISDDSMTENPLSDEKVKDELNTQKYLSFSCRFEFVKVIGNGLDIKFIPDYGVFFDLNNIDFDYKVNLPFVDYIRIAHRLFTYETHDVWPELSN